MTIVRLHLTGGVCMTSIVKRLLYSCNNPIKFIGWHVSDGGCRNDICVKRVSDGVCPTIFGVCLTMFLECFCTMKIVRRHLTDGVCTTFLSDDVCTDAIVRIKFIGWHVSDAVCRNDICVKLVSDGVCPTTYLDDVCPTMFLECFCTMKNFRRHLTGGVFTT